MITKFPKHSNPTRADRISFAPYNFIPLPQKVVHVDNVPQDVYMHNTGFIECKLTTESPLYTRCAMNPEFFRQYGEPPSFEELNEEQKNERGQFFQLETVPVIPGSSLRGMVRSLVEIAGYGKMRWVTDKRLIFRAVAEEFYREKFFGTMKRVNGKMWFDYPLSNVRGGYLRRKYSKWWIQPARDINGENFVHVEEYGVANCGFHDPEQDYSSKDIIDVYIRPPTNRTEPSRSNPNLILRLAIINKRYDIIIKDASTPKPNGFEKAVIVRSGYMGGKIKKHMHCAIYEPQDDEKWIEIPSSLWSLYEEDRDQKRGIKTRPLKNDYDPLFYLVDKNGELVFFGSTMMFRLPYDMRVIDFVPERIEETEIIDIADAIFGHVDENSNKACAGKVFFTDAKYESEINGIWFTKDPFTPNILASPKPTTFQHYLVQDRQRKHDPDNRGQLAHYATPTPVETVIRGNKMYWHKNEISIDEIREKDNVKLRRSPKQYTRIKPVNRGVTFSFRIYFDNLRDHELGALLWVLTPRGEDGKKYRHKLGMGKPLGLGSVKIEPKLHLSNRVKRYESLFDGNKWAEAVEEKSDIDSYIKKFEDFLWVKIDPKEKETAKNFKYLDRIKMLLKMLEWPGPDKELTRYLEIDEFRQRPVLPDPLHVGQSLLQSSASASSKSAKDFQKPKRKWRY